MKLIDCREKFSQWDSYAFWNPTNLGLFLAILLLTFLAPLNLSAGGNLPDKPNLGELCLSSVEEAKAATTVWTISLSPSAGTGASTEVTLLEDFDNIFPGGSLSASISADGATLTIQLNAGPLPAGASGDLALVEVVNSVGVTHSTWRLTAGGGNVIVVLVDD